MSTNAIVSIGAFFPPGAQENGRLFLKLDGVNDGLYVYYNTRWLKLAKISSVSDSLDVFTGSIPTINKYINDQITEDLQITSGGSF